MSTKIPGKFKEQDTGQLSLLVSGKNVLMLGCYCGRALVIVAKYAWATWVLTDFHGREGAEGVVGELMANADRYFPEDAEVNLIRDHSPGVWVYPDGARELPEDGVEVVYRDADRRDETRELDDVLAFQHLKQGGVYAWHDADGNLKWLEVKAAPQEVK